MNTAEIINSIKEHVAAAYTAVTGKNGTIPEQKNLSNLAAAIDSIQIGSSAENPYKARTYSEMNGYRTKNYGNAYVEYTGQRQFTRDQIQDSSMYDKLYFDFPRQIGWVETFDWNNPDSNWTSDGLLYKCIVLFNVTPIKISDNTTEEAMPFSVYQMTTTVDSSDAQAGTVMYGIGFPSSFSWVSWGGTPDKEYSRTGYKLKITNVKREYYYLIGDIISTTGEWSQIMDGTQFGYKHGTYKIDTNSNTIDNFQKLNLVLEDGGGGTARKTITNDYSYNLDSYYDYILKYSYEGKSSSVICKVGNFKFEGTQVTGANQLYNVTSDGQPDGIFFSLDPSCPLPYGWNAASIIDNFDLSNPKQSTPNKSVVGVSSNLYTLVGKTVTIEDISTAADMIYYTTLPSLSTPATATDIIKGKEAIDAEGNRINGTFEPIVLPTLTNEGTAADLVAGKQLISSSGEIITGSYEGVVLPTLDNEGIASDLAFGKQLIGSNGKIVTGSYEKLVLPTLTNEGTAADLIKGKQLISSTGEIVIGSYDPSNPQLPQLNSVSIAKSDNNINITNPSTNGNFVVGYKIYVNGELKNEQSVMTFDLLSLDPNKYAIRVRAKGNYFNDSLDSNTIDVTVFNIVYNLTDINASISTTKITNGQTLSFTLMPVTDKYLPLSIQIECNGQTLDYTYDDYSGAVNINTIALEYGDGTQNTINITAVALNTPKLHAPTLSIDGDMLYAKPPKYATSLEYYMNGTLFSTDADLSFPTFDVVAVPDAEYGFELNSESYYVSKNYHIQNSAALCKVIFNVPSETEVRLDCINSGEDNYDYGIISQLDKTLSTNNRDDGSTGTTNVLKNFKGASSTNVQEVTFTVPAGEHFIYIKYRKDSSSDSGNDTLQFKVNLL